MEPSSSTSVPTISENSSEALRKVAGELEKRQNRQLRVEWAIFAMQNAVRKRDRRGDRGTDQLGALTEKNKATKATKRTTQSSLAGELPAANSTTA